MCREHATGVEELIVWRRTHEAVNIKRHAGTHGRLLLHWRLGCSDGWLIFIDLRRKWITDIQSLAAFRGFRLMAYTYRPLRECIVAVHCTLQQYCTHSTSAIPWPIRTDFVFTTLQLHEDYTRISAYSKSLCHDAQHVSARGICAEACRIHREALCRVQVFRLYTIMHSPMPWILRSVPCRHSSVLHEQRHAARMRTLHLQPMYITNRCTDGFLKSLTIDHYIIIEV